MTKLHSRNSYNEIEFEVVIVCSKFKYLILSFIYLQALIATWGNGLK